MSATPQPDSPLSFGYKCAWLAIRCESSEAVSSALHLRQAFPSTWADGIEAAYAGRVFVTPPISGWVLATSTALPDTGDARHPDRITPLLVVLGALFPEVQYFGTHRVVEWHAWAKFAGGKFVRKFAFVGDQGATVWNFGGITPEEAQLHLYFTEGGAWLDEGPGPDEDSVTSLAALWSVDPSTFEEQDLQPSLGIIGDLPK